MNRKIMASAIFFGSIWGIIEALFGGFMHVVLPFFPYTGAIMIALAMPFIIGANKEGTLLLSGAIAASFKLIDFFIFPSVSILRPMVAIMCEAAFLAILLHFLPDARGSLLGITAALGSAVTVLPGRIDVSIIISIPIAALLCEMTTMLKVDKIRAGPKSAPALFIIAIVSTLLL